jgi:hypothetical protein
MISLVHRVTLLQARFLAQVTRTVGLVSLLIESSACGGAFTSISEDTDAGQPATQSDAAAPEPAEAGAPDSGVPPKEAAPINPNATIACSTDQCEPGTEICCMQNANDLPDFCVGGPGQPDKCTSDKATVTELSCDDSEDCAKAGTPGICCGQARFNPDPSLTVWARVRCVPLSECLKPDDDVFCGSNDADCPPGKTCTAKVGPYGLCQ